VKRILREFFHEGKGADPIVHFPIMFKSLLLTSIGLSV